ncbi:MAG TPA: hypothetical protein VN631_06885, partial [Negativicutes bacterium]|nr:hypothetical protein [Negativicutes bacterium]
MKLRIQGTSKLALAFLGYCIVIWMTEFVDLIAFCLNLPQTSLVSRVTVLVVVALVTYLLIQSKMISINLKTNTYGWEVLSAVFIILILGFLKGIIPDFSYDTGNYHLSNQNPGFVNLLTEHFA